MKAAMKTLLLIGLVPFAAEAQLTIYAENGTETLVGSSFQFGQIAVNTTSAVTFRIYNTGSMPVSTNVFLNGAGFTFVAPPLPDTIPPHSTAPQSLNITVSFTPTSTASFSASLQVNSLSVILQGSGVAAPSFTSVSGCSTSAPYNFGSVKGSGTCSFSLANLNPQAITVPSIIIIGQGFTGPYGVSTPLVLQAGQSATFSVNFTPPGYSIYNGSIAIGSQSFALTGIGQAPLLPTPSLLFDSGAFSSGQQRVLTMTIPGGAPIAATGYVNLTFAPSTAVVRDDTAIMFLANSSRSIPFSVSLGATTALLNGQTSATFQTGTTEGILTFTVTTAAGMTGDPTTKATIPGTSVTIVTSSASKERIGDLDITLIGADNTYSAGAMSFSFFDTNGNAISNAVNADFTSTFKSYYAGQTSGSAFQVLVSFPVLGSVVGIGSVTVTMTNVAGPATTAKLTFQ